MSYEYIVDSWSNLPAWLCGATVGQLFHQTRFTWETVEPVKSNIAAGPAVLLASAVTSLRVSAPVVLRGQEPTAKLYHSPLSQLGWNILDGNIIESKTGMISDYNLDVQTKIVQIQNNIYCESLINLLRQNLYCYAIFYITTNYIVGLSFCVPFPHSKCCFIISIFKARHCWQPKNDLGKHERVNNQIQTQRINNVSLLALL